MKKNENKMKIKENDKLSFGNISHNFDVFDS